MSKYQSRRSRNNFSKKPVQPESARNNQKDDISQDLNGLILQLKKDLPTQWFERFDFSKPWKVDSITNTWYETAGLLSLCDQESIQNGYYIPVKNILHSYDYPDWCGYWEHLEFEKLLNQYPGYKVVSKQQGGLSVDDVHCYTSLIHGQITIIFYC